MKKLLLLAFIFCACGVNTEIKTDARINIQNPDQQIIDTQSTDHPKPEKCSPAGNYTFNMSVYYNTCPIDVVPELSWTTDPVHFISYDCGTYKSFKWLNHKYLPDVKVYCLFTAVMDPGGTYADIKCEVFRDDKVICKYSYSCPLAHPDEWK